MKRELQSFGNTKKYPWNTKYFGNHRMKLIINQVNHELLTSILLVGFQSFMALQKIHQSFERFIPLKVFVVISDFIPQSESALVLVPRHALFVIPISLAIISAINQRKNQNSQAKLIIDERLAVKLKVVHLVCLFSI